MIRLRLAPFCILGLSLAASAQTQLTTERVATGLSQPLFVTAPGGDFDRLFIVEQPGRIKILSGGNVLPAPFLDISTKTRGSGERGLLGLAFHPDYWNNGYFFVNYTRSSDGRTIIERYQVSATNPNLADPLSDTMMLAPIFQPYSNHNGGCIQFGLDGYLYIGMGDGGSGGDPGCRAQNGQDLLGKILRIDVDNPASVIPPSNPFVNDPAVRDEIWALGVRNPWRFSFDRVTGDLWMGDVGQNNIEEIDFQPGTSTGGENYGWKVMEGNNCFSTSACSSSVPPCNDPRLTGPVHTYTHSVGYSVTGGYVYRGCAIPDLRGTYFFADFGTRRIWSFRYDGSQMTGFQDRTNELRPTVGSLTSLASFGEDAAGELYIVSLAGSIYKIVPNGPAPAIDLGFGEVGSNGLVPRFSVCGLLTAGSVAEFHLDDAPGSTIAALALSRFNAPTMVANVGTVVPFPVDLIATFEFTSPEGSVMFPARGGLGPWQVVGQWAVLDLGLPGGIGLSNALQIVFP